MLLQLRLWVVGDRGAPAHSHLPLLLLQTATRAVAARPISPAAAASSTHASCRRPHSPRRSRRGVAASGTNSTANTRKPDRPSAVTAVLIYVRADCAMKPHREARGFNGKLSGKLDGAAMTIDARALLLCSPLVQPAAAPAALPLQPLPFPLLSSLLHCHCACGGGGGYGAIGRFLF